MTRWIASLLTLLLFLPLARPAAADPRADALALSRQALEAYLASEFGLAADLYTRAYQTWAAEPLYLYNAARASQRAGRNAAAAHMYRTYLAIAPPSQPEVAKARFHLQEVAASQTLAPPDKAKPPPAAHGNPTPGGAVALVVIGGIAAGAGAILLGLGASDQAALDAKYRQVDATGAIIGINANAAKSEQERINTKLVAGWATLGAGAVLGVVGAILWSRAGPATTATANESSAATLSLWPSGRGVGLGWRF